jgi:ABC-type multidrug transport system fused ATPase/permease subunit
MKKANSVQMNNVQLPQSKRVEEVKENMNKLQSSMKQFEYDEVLLPLSISFKNMYMKLKSTGKKDFVDVVDDSDDDHGDDGHDDDNNDDDDDTDDDDDDVCIALNIVNIISYIINHHHHHHFHLSMIIGGILLRNICATISPCIVTAIMGPSGAGKLLG